MYEPSTSPTFGLCYCIFCSNFNASKISYQASNLPVDGLTLVLDIEKDEYLRSSSEMGMIVMVHRRGVSPDPNEDGMYLSPYMTTYIGIEMRPGHRKDNIQNRALVKAVIYFESIIVEKITQVPELSDATTLSNVGGFMGMYLGLSFLVIFEILEIFVRWFIYLYHRRHASVAPQQEHTEPAPSTWQRHIDKAVEAARGSGRQGWLRHQKQQQRSCWEVMKDPRASGAGLVAVKRHPGPPQYGYFDSSDWKSAAEEVLGPLNPTFLHRGLRPRAFY
ncbi:hypothetical protein V5799_010281 [Amblyomma americanum]|uniref:Uncharacterized protein n=1 Tax=Amblyomma americanum TaxID=6943 RepID=A0AAQ4F9J2_AMBAM